MAQEDMNVIIPPEMMQEIVRIASETAVKAFHSEAEKTSKAVKDKYLHNTRWLLENYRGFVEHSKKAVYEATQVKEDEDLNELIEELMSGSDGRVRVPVVRSIKESAARTRTMVLHIEALIDAYKKYCEHTKKEEFLRRYRIIYGLYIADEPKTLQQIADEEGVDLSTVYRGKKAAIAQLSAFIFGFVD